MDNVKLMKAAINKGLKVLHLDIETSPCLVYSYPLRDAYIAENQIVVEPKVTSIAYMSENLKECFSVEWDWLGDIVINQHGVTGGGDDTAMLEAFGKIVSDADLIIGQNSDSFDMKILQWRMNVLRLQPIEHLLSIDTLKMSRKVFRPPSHKLNHRSSVYGFGGKIKQDMDDCMDVARGHVQKQALRVKYNVKDVVDTRKVFWHELPYYQLPIGIRRMLEDYIKEEKPFCLRCAGRKERKFDVKDIVQNNKPYLQCQNCDSKWSNKNAK